MSRHRHHKAFAWILGASLSAAAFVAIPVQTAQAAESAEFAVAVVKVTVRESNGRVYRAKTRAIRMGDAASFEVITDLHRHTIDLSSGEGGAELRYSRDGGELASRTASFGRITEKLEADGHTVTIEIVPTSVRVGTH
jgi:predicted outer membrane lipoprotein